ncbi:MAG TPA: Gfo/Idh/MocA family oxidoreductase, partial [Acidimicrobiales bacterium]
VVTGPVRIGVVGAGRLVERGYLPAFAAVPAARLVAVADPDEERRRFLAAHAAATLGHPVAAHEGADALLAAGGLDAVMIASPVGAHVADARAAAAAGIPALVEKPPAPDAAGAAELATLTPSPWIGFNRRFDPGARAVRAAVAATPTPDDPVDLRVRVQYRRPAWGARTVRDEALLDLGPHLVDWARWISGREVTAVACRTLTPERAVVDLTLDGGHARLEAATDRAHEELVELRGADGRRRARHRIGGLMAGARARLAGGGRPDSLVVSLTGELAALVAACRGEATDLGTVADGVAVMAVLDAARASHRAGGEPVPPTPPPPSSSTPAPSPAAPSDPSPPPEVPR